MRLVTPGFGVFLWTGNDFCQPFPTLFGRITSLNQVVLAYYFQRTQFTLNLHFLITFELQKFAWNNFFQYTLLLLTASSTFRWEYVGREKDYSAWTFHSLSSPPLSFSFVERKKTHTHTHNLRGKDIKRAYSVFQPTLQMCLRSQWCLEVVRIIQDRVSPLPPGTSIAISFKWGRTAIPYPCHGERMKGIGRSWESYDRAV